MAGGQRNLSAGCAFLFIRTGCLIFRLLLHCRSASLVSTTFQSEDRLYVNPMSLEWVMGTGEETGAWASTGLRIERGEW